MMPLFKELMAADMNIQLISQLPLLQPLLLILLVIIHLIFMESVDSLLLTLEVLSCTQRALQTLISLVLQLLRIFNI